LNSAIIAGNAMLSWPAPAVTVKIASATTHKAHHRWRGGEESFCAAIMHAKVFGIRERLSAPHHRELFYQRPIAPFSSD
jgi:hypothetical protein